MLTLSEIMDKYKLSEKKARTVVANIKAISDPASKGHRGRPCKVYDEEAVKARIEEMKAGISE